MRTLRLIVEYDGTGYEGWQFQPRGRTLQGLLEEKLAVLTRAPVRVHAAGRTDAGVHALGQVLIFTTESDIAPADLRHRMNALLPRDVGVVAADEVPHGFDPRRSATGKHYRYQVWNAAERSVFHERFSWHVRRPLDLDAMRAAAPQLLGAHDFTSFRASDCQAKTARRVLTRLELDDADAPLLVLHAEATAFLKHMVRNLVGTLVEVGMGRRDAATMTALLAARDRAQAGRTAPPQGLFLVQVFYD